MRRIAISACTLLGLFSLLLVSETALAAEKQGSGGSKAMVERGRYLVTIAGCNDCHSPKKMTQQGLVPDGARILSGHPADEKLAEIPQNLLGPDKWGGLCNNNLTAWVGPWGISYASNLTPDRETGFGNMNEVLFIKILRTGKFMGGERYILPPMPWQELGTMADGDLKAIFAYLKSLKPVKNQVPASQPAPPPHGY